jgi:hypothetical protein
MPFRSCSNKHTHMPSTISLPPLRQARRGGDGRNRRRRGRKRGPGRPSRGKKKRNASTADEGQDEWTAGAPPSVSTADEGADALNAGAPMITRATACDLYDHTPHARLLAWVWVGGCGGAGTRWHTGGGCRDPRASTAHAPDQLQPMITGAPACGHYDHAAQHFFQEKVYDK